VVADEGHKPASFQHLCGEYITALFDELQFLMFRIPHRDNHVAAVGKLSKERLRNRRSGSGNKDGAERSQVRQAERAVAAVNMRVGEAEPGKRGGSSGSKLRPPLDGENFLGQTGQHGSLIATARANFQNPVAWLQMQRRGHGGNNVGLRNGLTPADGQWHVLIRARTKRFRHKFVPRHCCHRRKNGLITNATTPQLLFDHFRALWRVVFVLKHA